MGLAVTVGNLADLKQHDPEGFEWETRAFTQINRALAEHDIAPHMEPTDIDVWYAEAIGYSGLHALRDIAAKVWHGVDIPRKKLITGDKNSTESILHGRACIKAVQPPPEPGVLARLFGRGKPELETPRFIHLVLHSDAEGYYIPRMFSAPIIPHPMPEESKHLWPLGSLPMLALEVEELSLVLEMPDNMSGDDAALVTAMDAPRTEPDAPLWQAQPIAAYHCAILRDACRYAQDTGAAIVFN